MKNAIKIICITFFVTLALTWGGREIVRVTGDAPFCGSCHEWDGFAAQAALNDDVHGGANPKGVKATCTDCHLPHDSLIKYLAVKAKNGVAEGWTTLTKDPGKKDWQADRAHARKNYTFDSSCLNCHENIVAVAKQDTQMLKNSSKMHVKYEEFKNTADAMRCTDCHKHVGHKDLGKAIFAKQDKTPKTWEEWDKQREEELKAHK